MNKEAAKHVLALTRYENLGASSRVRTSQFVPILEAEGFTVQRNALLSDAYVRHLYTRGTRSVSFLSGYWNRLRLLLQKSYWDIVWIEKEILPWVPALFESMLRPAGKLVVDYDDAIFHNYDRSPHFLVRSLLGKKCDQLMANSDLVIVGSHYLKDRAATAGARKIELVPSVVDCRRYQLGPARNTPAVIGWIGSPATEHFLAELMPTLGRVCRDTGAVVHLIGANPSSFSAPWLRVLPWTEASEVELLAEIDVGVMPLTDGPWERGKCGYKLIQYMAAGKPVVASPVGENGYIVKQGVNGYLAENAAEWENHLTRLLRNHELRFEMGRAARATTLHGYDIAVAGARIASLFHSLTQ